MPDIEAARQFCDQTISAVSEPTRARVASERAHHVRAAMAALARCRALLIGVVTLDRGGCADVVGVNVRAMLEAWYFGVIALLGTDDDLERLDADHRHWKNRLAKEWPGVVPDPTPGRVYPVRDRAVRAGVLMSEVGETSDGPLRWYLEYYAAESLMNAHASASSLGQYLVVGADGVIGVDHDPVVDEGPRYGRLLMAAVLVITLARWVYSQADIDVTSLDNLELPGSGP